MAAVAELTLLEKSLGLSKGNKYNAQGERQVRSGGGVEGKGVVGRERGLLSRAGVDGVSMRPFTSPRVCPAGLAGTSGRLRAALAPGNRWTNLLP